jgi:hypothetical protein
VPGGDAKHQTAQDLNSVDLNLVVYHPYPDENGDTWGFPERTVNGTEVDWMAGTYGALLFPTAAFDGVHLIEQTLQGVGAGEYQVTHETYRRVIEERIARDAPATLRIDGSLGQDVLSATVEVVPDAPIQGSGLTLRVLLVEDDVAYDGGNGVLNHRFTVRSSKTESNLSLAAALERNVTFLVPQSSDATRLGVVAILQNFDPASSVFKEKEVLQSATWMLRQTGPTIQNARGVLLELYSATWCTACIVGDAVTDDLANAYGVQSTRVTERAFEYLRLGDAWRPVAALAAGIGITLWLRRTRAPEAPREP